ncbi:HAD-IIIA family hydrolase [Facklamia sp. DSM 111018]|uniref:D,D-heptose 1,7-bisphosphate phosphatase n=1 Tax=Facklamia lactis TaxID=2749967 RepID=A0ABS0LN76_9LACT|nr:HAD-IIIA family hydrolase [Facklamia lactis]MBG9979709.1 HAD-IIIA family hydrolase [Facklamia lactis]MBG9985611.1 HAD-IIIA family hydrolase [Facklamia lactis]
MNKAIFWDLLGTLGGNSKTLIKDFEFFDHSIESLKKARENDYLNILVTNQSTIGHGKIGLTEYENYLEKMRKLLHNNDCDFDEVYTCPHRRIDNCECKKPKVKMITQAKDKFNIDLVSSFVIGDTIKNDMLLANNAGINGILVLTGEGNEELSNFHKNINEPHFFRIEKDALSAIEYICKVSRSLYKN